MIEIASDETWPSQFQRAVSELSEAAVRSELGLIQIPAPRNLATYSIAFAASAESLASDGDIELSSGRFILLYESKTQTEWNSNFRIVCFAKSPIELDIADDHLVADVAWGWLTSSLKQRGANFSAAAGTATRVISSGYGSLSEQTNHAELELRASWTPGELPFAPHIEAWQDLVCHMAGHIEQHSDVISLASKLP